MPKQISEERVKEKLKEVENTDVEEFYPEIDGTYSTMFVNRKENINEKRYYL